MIELRRVTLRAGQFSLENVSFSVASGEYAVLMGRTGRGKTTVLEAICGLRQVSEGAILLHGDDVTDWSPADRAVGYVPQDLALFPTMTVAQHLEFALRIRGAAQPAIREAVREMAELLGITHLLGRGVQRLSGGESQRVALGRALSFHPRVLLLDEPLSALDESTREDIQSLLLSIRERTGVTTLHVTHSRSEALALADKLLILDDGRITETDRRAGSTPARSVQQETA
ncbi:MAG: ATP-binding cassette domain-containing protein [Planctomycetota bacterium]|nr:MAG: ATP-binding cassette domain-containing protein [Planctomycetota bacterium]REJ96215.1 MAG: ATP-binding cassette domain-containing protein [Planctomycetota bacterium]REK24469.1 MAG: ATP-binding cassette domain-containing protein [Planctomycetota bacterium]REK38658.1 MAG: ATP-binding cassette domain-containing protein [Planctomycetota bacterium]